MSKELTVELKESITKLFDLCEALRTELEDVNEKCVKAAARRARKLTLQLAKEGRTFRELSCKEL